VVGKALAHSEVYSFCRPLVVGSAAFIPADPSHVGAELAVREAASPEDAGFTYGTVDVLSPTSVDPKQVRVGEVCTESGRAAADWVIAAVDLALAGRIDGIVTAPLNKKAMNRAGYHYAGHTELLGERTASQEVRLMLASERVNVAHVTGHMALSEVPARITEERVYDTIVLMADALVSMGRAAPRIAVCGLNPHAGESGLFGNEDDRVVRPAVERAAGEGWEVEGPLPADTTFFKAYDGLYDGIVAMYHDQGHVPAKLVAFEEAVNVTLGLPIVRTSVDHGTAFDIAGKGIANEANMLQALRLGAQLAAGRAH